MSTFDRVLALKGWVIFVVLLTAALFGFGSMVLSGFRSFGGLDPAFFGLGMALMELLYFGWALAVGVAMNARLPESLRRGQIFPAVGLMIATGYSFWFAGQFASPSGPPASGGAWIALHLFSMFINFYLIWFVSRALVAAEENGKPPLDRILGLFFVLWFSLCFPVGAWWAQNRARAVAGRTAP